jgi:hypothetical protein
MKVNVTSSLQEVIVIMNVIYIVIVEHVSLNVNLMLLDILPHACSNNG